MDQVPVYESRLRMGEKLAQKIMRLYPDHGIDVVVPIPETSRASALQAAYTLGCPFREGFIKNRYIARTFIMPGQKERKKSVRLKLNTIKSEVRLDFSFSKLTIPADSYYFSSLGSLPARMSFWWMIV